MGGAERGQQFAVESQAMDEWVTLTSRGHHVDG